MGEGGPLFPKKLASPCLQGEGDRVSGGRGGAYGASKNAASGRLKPYNRPDGRGKCTPSVAFGDISPGGGDVSGVMHRVA